MKCSSYKPKKIGKSGMQKQLKNLCFLALLLLTASACSNNSDYSPKPRGFFRINFHAKDYKPLQTGCPFTFEAPSYSQLTPDLSTGADPCWKNLDFPEYNARLHLSYMDIGPNATLAQLSEDARTFAFKHTAKATAIDQSRVNDPAKKVYGLTYFIRGNAASNLQFYVSDSTKHYLRGALYFNEKPNLDSIQPVLDFLGADVQHIINTLQWK